MKTKDVLLKSLTGRYEGYMLQTIYEHDKTPFAWDACKPLLKIPRKISYFLDRSKIVEVRKTTFNNIDQDYYLVKLTDNTYLELVY